MVHRFGLVTYRQGKDEGTLIAEWVNDDPNDIDNENGIGLAKSINATTDAFDGDYEVEYWHGGAAIKRELIIKKNGPIFDMIWSEAGEVTNTGYGFICGELLVAGYTR